jgi:hypothetical protein
MTRAEIVRDALNMTFRVSTVVGGSAPISSQLGVATMRISTTTTGESSQATGPRVGPSWARTLLSLLAVAVFVLASCSGDDDGEASSSTVAPTSTEGTTAPSSTEATSASAPTTSTTASADPEQAVIDRYLAFWSARFAAQSEPVDPAATSFAELAVDPQLSQIRAETQQRVDDGVALRAPSPSITEHRVSIVSLGPDEAVLQDCYTNDTIVYRTATGEVVNDKVGTDSIKVTMRLVSGVWKLERATLVQQWEGVAGCAAGA